MDWCPFKNIQFKHVHILIIFFSQNNSTNNFHMANGLFPANGFKPLEEYITAIRNIYNGSVQEVSYSNVEQAADIINSWADTNTQGLIKQVVTPGKISL